MKNTNKAKENVAAENENELDEMELKEVNGGTHLSDNFYNDLSTPTNTNGIPELPSHGLNERCYDDMFKEH